MSEHEQITGDTLPAAPRWRRRILPLVFLLLGAAAVTIAVKSRRPPKRRDVATRGLLVETVEAKAATRRVRVTGNGVVRPRRQVTVAPQVGGPVVWVHPNLDVGAYIKKGAVLLRIDGADYAIALERARAAVATAEQAAAQAEAASRVAREEWRRAGHQGQASPLVLKVPQLAAARAALRSARAGVRQAQLNLARTSVRAPFNLRIRQKMVDIGQYVRPGQGLLTVYGTDRAEIITSLPASEARWLDLPRPGRRRAGPPPEVTIALRTGRGIHRRPGKLLRSLGEVDPTGRMARVVVGLDDPFNLRPDAPAGAPDFDLGSFVDVTIAGRTLAGAVAIPEVALRVGSVVWVAAPEGKLRIRKVSVARRLPHRVFLTAGVAAGERVIVSHVGGAVDGMKIRLRGTEGAAPAAARKPPEQAMRGGSARP